MNPFSISSQKKKEKKEKKRKKKKMKKKIEKIISNKKNLFRFDSFKRFCSQSGKQERTLFDTLLLRTSIFEQRLKIPTAHNRIENLVRNEEEKRMIEQ